MVLMVEATFDMYGLSSIVKRYSTRGVTPYTLGAYTYADLLSRLQLGAIELKPEGGLAPVYSFTIVVRDEEGESALTDTHVLANDEVVIYGIFVTGAEIESDRFEIMRGVVEKDSSDGTLWTLRCKDGSKKELRWIPNDLVDPTRYPYAWTPESPMPEAFGSHMVGPHDSVGKVVSLAPCRFLNRYDMTCTSGLNKKAGGQPYQWYGQVNRFAEIVTYTETAGILTVADPARKMRIYPSRPKLTNDLTYWYLTADGNGSTVVTVSDGDNLDVWLSGCAAVGDLTGIAVKVFASGSYTLTVKDDTTVKYGPTGCSGDTSVALTPGDYADWKLALLNVEIDGASSEDSTIEQIYLEVLFDDYLSFDQDEPQVYQKVEGWEDQAAKYTDGAVISGAGTMLRNPVFQLEVLLRGLKMNALEIARVNTANFTAMAAYRTSWLFDWALPLDQQVNENQIDRLGFEAGLYILTQSGQWDVAAMDKTRAPQHFFAGNYHMPVDGDPVAPPWDYDFSLQPADASQIYNEVVIRFAKQPATGQYQRAAIASGQYRLTGTGTSANATGYLVDATATFVTDGVVAADAALGTAGEIVYIEGDQDYEVITVVNETTIELDPVDGGSVRDNTSKTYWLGPHLNGDTLISQLAYKTVNALGGVRQRQLRDEGGYKSDFIQDESTATLLKNHIVDWFSFPRDRLQFPLLHDGALVQPGDVLMLNHPKLPTSKKPVLLSAIALDVTAVATTIIVTAGTVALFRDDDWLCIQETESTPPEVVQVDTVDVATDTLTVIRARLGTKAQAFTAGTGLYRVIYKWVCTGLEPLTPDKWNTVQVEQMPRYYTPTGKVSATGWPLWASASDVQRSLSGWSTLPNGRVVDLEKDSDISYVGADSGAYIIT